MIFLYKKSLTTCHCSLILRPLFRLFAPLPHRRPASFLRPLYRPPHVWQGGRSQMSSHISASKDFLFTILERDRWSLTNVLPNICSKGISFCLLYWKGIGGRSQMSSCKYSAEVLFCCMRGQAVAHKCPPPYVE
jgi:hypothetical protein